MLLLSYLFLLGKNDYSKQVFANNFVEKYFYWLALWNSYTIICTNVNDHWLSDSSCSKFDNFADLKYDISNFEVLSQISLCLQGKFINWWCFHYYFSGQRIWLLCLNLLSIHVITLQIQFETTIPQFCCHATCHVGGIFRRGYNN